MFHLLTILLTSVMAASTGASQEPPGSILLMPPHGVTQPIDYREAAAWICRPDTDGEACSTGLDALAIDGRGARTLSPYVAAKDPPIDCFYVYPTSSSDPTLYSGMVPDAAIRRVVQDQAARLGARCRLFVPIYHQVTIAGLKWSMAHNGAGKGIPIDTDIPYRDVLAAWRDYLIHDNQGRAFVLVGHSQGSTILKRLIAEEIDGKPVQKRLLAAYLAGVTDLSTATFKHISPCRAADQTGCVIAWSSYIDGYAGPRIFGGAGGGAAPICVNPATLGGGRGKVKAYFRKLDTGPVGDPPYIESLDQISAECVADGKGAVLRIRIESSVDAGFLAATIKPSRAGPDWGLHPLDINLVEGNILNLIASQKAAWSKYHQLQGRRGGVNRRDGGDRDAVRSR